MPGDLLFFLLFAGMATLIRLPLSFLAGWVVPHHFGLSSQSPGVWAVDEMKAFALFVVIGAPSTAGVLRAIRHSPRRWWLLCWLVFIPVATAMVMAQPLVVDPLFNDLILLRDSSLRVAILQEAEAAGLHGARVLEVDRSRQTHEMNAYVDGLGPTARIVVWDTLLRKMRRDEILFVVAHEIGHDRLHHVRNGLVFAWFYGFLALLIGARVVPWGIHRFGARWDVLSMGDRAAIPWLAFVLVVILFLSSPILSAFSRHQEHAADLFALRLTGLRDAGARSFILFATDSKVDPDPPPLLVLWTWSHPSLLDRVRLCREWPRTAPDPLR